MATDPFGLVGTTLEGKYRIEGPVGEGGFGVVYRGHHLTLDAPIAIKCLKVPPDFDAEGRAGFLTAFLREARLQNALASQHPAVVRVYDFGVLQGAAQASIPYLVLEWLDGRDLESMIADRRPLGEREATNILLPAIEALAAAHAMEPPIAHRDVKPPNVFVQRNGRTKLLDFGIAKAMQEGEAATARVTRTSSGFRAFSPTYGAPEQFLSKQFGPTGPWTDVHALGLMLAELTSGKTPYVGQDAFEILAEATNPVRPTPRRLGAVVSDAFEALVARCLALQAEQRIPDARALLEAIGALSAPAASPDRGAHPMGPASAPQGASPTRPEATIAAAPLPDYAFAGGAPSVPGPPAPSSRATPGGDFGHASPPRAKLSRNTRLWIGILVAAPVVLYGMLSLGTVLTFATVSAPPPPVMVVSGPERDVAREATTPSPSTVPTGEGGLDVRTSEDETGGQDGAGSPTVSAPSKAPKDDGARTLLDALAKPSPSSPPPSPPAPGPTTPSTVPAGGAPVAAPPGAAPTGEPSANGSLSRSAVQGVVRRNSAQTQYCWQKQLQLRPEAGRTTVVVHFVIGPSGAVTSASGSGAEGYPGLSSCVAARVQRWVFPAPEGGGSVRINYPFAFAP